MPQMAQQEVGPRCTLQITKTVLGLWIFPGSCGVCAPVMLGPGSPGDICLSCSFVL